MSEWITSPLPSQTLGSLRAKVCRGYALAPLIIRGLRSYVITAWVSVLP